MKKSIALLMVLTMCFAMTACGGGNSGSKSKEDQAEPLNLTGTWTQTNGNEDMWQEAVIDGDTIEINWISEGGDTKSLYWAGSFKAPTESTKEYTWTSENDKEKTDSAMLASGDDTKEFNYKDSVISYEASALGTTKTIKLEKK